MNQSDIKSIFVRFADRPAITTQDAQRKSYQQLGDEIGQTLQLFQQLGIQPGDTVCLLAKNTPLWFTLFFSALYSGVRLAPANWRLAESELGPLIDELSPKLVISSPEFEQTATSIAPSAQHQTIGQWEIASSRLPRSWPSYLQPSANCSVLLLKTGGTTGRAKWAMQRLEQLWLNATHTAKVCEFDEHSCAIQATPLFHAGANALSTPLLINGGHVVLMEDFAPQRYVELAMQQQATVVFAVPTVYQMLLKNPDFTADAMPSVKWLLSGGAPCPRDLAARLAERGFTVKQGFGMTEVGVNCFQFATVASPSGVTDKTNAVGRPMPHTQMEIVDGELVISGHAIFGGYLSDIRRGESPPTNVTTGDLFSVDDSGCYFVNGRKKEMYISGGENVYPLEVENHLADHPDINAVAVTGVDSERWGETGLAACVLKQQMTESELATAISDFLGNRLAKYKHPKHALIFQELPLTPAGKVDKKAIQATWKSV